MRFIIFLLFAVFLSQNSIAQSIKLTQLEKGVVGASPVKGLVGVTRASDGKQRYMTYVNVADLCINYTPLPTNNLSNLNNFVQKCATDSIWYIDFEGRSIFLGRANASGGGAVADRDWLTITTRAIPDSIGNAIFTYNKASIGANYDWPGAELLVNDSISGAVAIAQGNRVAGWTAYNKLSGAWTRFGHDGSVGLITCDPLTSKLFIQQSGSGTAQNPLGPFTTRMEVDFATGSIKFNSYPSTRNDVGISPNFLGTDALGNIVSNPTGDIPVGGTHAFGTIGNITIPDESITGDQIENNSIAPSKIIGDAIGNVGDVLTIGGVGAPEWLPPTGGGGGGNAPDSTFKKIGRTDFWGKNSTSPVYREGKITIGSSSALDTSAVLNIVGGNELSNQFGIHIRGDATNIIKISGDSRATTPIAKTDFNIGRSFFASVSPAGDNQVFNGGINYTAGGSHKERYQSAIGWALETNYKNSPSELGDSGYGFYEAQWPEVVYSDSTKGSDNIIRPTGVTDGSKRRAIAGYFSNQKPSNGGYLGFCSDINYYVDWKANTSRATWGFADGTTKGIVFLDTARVQFSVNNAGGIIMSDNVGGGRNVLKMDNLNRLVLFEDGSGGTIYTPANKITAQNALTLEAGSGQPVTIGTTANTANVSINAIAGVPLTIRSSLNTTGYGFQADNFIFSIKDLSTNNDVIIFDKTAPNFSLWVRSNGHVGLGGYPDFDALFHINKSATTPNFALSRFTNTTGSTSFYRRADSPESVQAAPTGDICNSANGNLYIKKTGTGNTGWEATVTSAGGTPTLMHEETFIPATPTTVFTLTGYTPAAPSGTNIPIRVYRAGTRLYYDPSPSSNSHFSYSGATVTLFLSTSGLPVVIEYLK